MLRALLEAADGPAAVHELLLGPFAARVVVGEGQVRSAHAGPFAGEDALFRLLLVSDRPVRSHPRTAPIADEPTVGPAAALLERFDSFARDLQQQSARAGGLPRIWTVRFRALKSVLQGLPDDVKRVVRLLDGTRDLRTLIAESPLSPPLTLKVVERLLQHGALERADLQADDGDDAALALVSSPGAASVDRSWLQERASRHPAPAPSTPPTAAADPAPTPAAPSTTPTAELVLLEKRRVPMAGALPSAIPAPRAARGAELSAWLGPEEALGRERPSELVVETWAPWTLVILVVAGAAIGAVLALLVVG